MDPTKPYGNPTRPFGDPTRFGLVLKVLSQFGKLKPDVRQTGMGWNISDLPDYKIT